MFLREPQELRGKAEHYLAIERRVIREPKAIEDGKRRLYQDSLIITHRPIGAVRWT